MRFDSPRKLAHIRADEVECGDLLMEPINAFNTSGRTVHREEGRVSRAFMSPVLGRVLLSWRTPYGEERHEELAPHRCVVVIRTEDWNRK